jgi:hypothetical protein
MLVDDSLYPRRANLGRSIAVLAAKRNLTAEDFDLIGKHEQEIRQIERQVGNVLTERRFKVFNQWLRCGRDRLSYDQRVALEEVEYRATVGLEGGGAAYLGSTNGVIVAMACRDAIQSATKYAGPLMQIGEVDWTPKET